MHSGSISKVRSYRLLIAGWPEAMLWLAAVLAGFAFVIEFDMTPGEAGTAPLYRPAGIMPPLACDRPTLILFAHPRCPCTRASVGELNRVLTTCPDLADVRVFFRTPENPSEEWTPPPLWLDAANLPGTTVGSDPGGALAARCDVKTSGHVLVYSAEGRLLFSGGITAARGEEGENPGRSAVVALLKGQPSVATSSQVYGCPLFDFRAACTTGKACPKP